MSSNKKPNFNSKNLRGIDPNETGCCMNSPVVVQDIQGENISIVFRSNQNRTFSNCQAALENEMQNIQLNLHRFNDNESLLNIKRLFFSYPHLVLEQNKDLIPKVAPDNMPINIWKSGIDCNDLKGTCCTYTEENPCIVTTIAECIELYNNDSRIYNYLLDDYVPWTNPGQFGGECKNHCQTFRFV